MGKFLLPNEHKMASPPTSPSGFPEEEQVVRKQGCLGYDKGKLTVCVRVVFGFFRRQPVQKWFTIRNLSSDKSEKFPPAYGKGS